MLTEDNFAEYVGFQEGGHAYFMAMRFTPEEDWTKQMGNMSVEEVFNRLTDETPPIKKMNMDIVRIPACCDATLEQALVVANAALRTLPKTNLSDSRASIEVARSSKRGVANKRLDDIVLYRGTVKNDVDCAMVIVKVDGKYGVVKHPDFEKYGLILDGGSKV